MSTGTVIVIVVVLVLLAIAAVAVRTLTRRRAAGRARYGPEYDRLAEETSPREAEAEFAKRRRRVAKLRLMSLTPERRSAYAGQWEAAQELFVDEPAQAVTTAGSLVTAVAVDRGYEAADPDQFLTDLSVHHGRHLDGYRHARQTSGQASTEELRRALLEYRGLFFDLVESPGDGHGSAPVPAQGEALDDRPWKHVTQGRHWKTQRQSEGADAAVTKP